VTKVPIQEGNLGAGIPAVRGTAKSARSFHAQSSRNLPQKEMKQSWPCVRTIPSHLNLNRAAPAVPT